MSLNVVVHWRITLRFLLFLPRGYETSTVLWPVMFFLHGSGERGSDIEKVKLNGPPKLVERDPDFPFILVSPQLESEVVWNPHDLHALLGELLKRLRIDPGRVIATGLSLGGGGTWLWATHYPQDLAAAVPVSGYGDEDHAARAKPVPLRAYHGSDDTVVPVLEHRRMVDALREAGGQVDFIVFPDTGHDAWSQAYVDPLLLPWMLAQRSRA
jgi:predicted peptidase